MAKDNLIPIKVKIRYGNSKGRIQHIYPDFDLVPESIRNGMTWTKYIDIYGLGWHYDKKSGIGEVDTENPDPEVWWGCICIPKDFADDALSRFPNDLEVLTETEFASFYDNRAHDHEPSVFDDAEVLSSLASRVALGDLAKDDSEVTKALDPDDSTPGRIRNTRKTWALLKTSKGYEIDQSQRV